MIHEVAPAKVNLVLQVGERRADGLHELCSLIASVDLVDDVAVARSAEAREEIVCPGVEGQNLCAAAIEALRDELGGGAALPALDVRIEKRIPLAAGLGGGSADAAAVLRAANALAGRPLDDRALRRVAARVGSDVPGQLSAGHALVTGAGESVEPLLLPPLHFVLVPAREGLATGDVYREADRIGATRARLDPEAVRTLAAEPAEQLAAGLENDLQAAAISLRPQLATTIAALERQAALAAQVTGSGPTVFGVFADEDAARGAASAIPKAVVAAIRHN